MALTTVPVELANLDGAVTVNESSADADFRIESNGDTHRLFIDGGNDRILIGTTASRTMSGVTPDFFIEGTSYADSSIGAVINANGQIDCPAMFFGKSRGTTLGSNTVVQNGDRLFSMRIDGSDGTNLEQAAIIEVYVDGTVGNNTIPGQFRFMTTTVGDQYATEKMRIQSDGALRSGGSAFGNITGGMNYVTLADDATKTIALSGTATAGGALLIVYDGQSGDTCLFHVGYGHASIVSQSVSNFATSDTDNKYCVIVSGHNISFKNRLGSSKNLNIMVYGAGNFNYNL